jgi:hypothetical protein
MYLKRMGFLSGLCNKLDIIYKHPIICAKRQLHPRDLSKVSFSKQSENKPLNFNKRLIFERFVSSSPSMMSSWINKKTNQRALMLMNLKRTTMPSFFEFSKTIFKMRLNMLQIDSSFAHSQFFKGTLQVFIYFIIF